MLLFVLLYIALGGVFGDEDEVCDLYNMDRTCGHFHPTIEEWNEISGVPNEEELAKLCPGELKYSECFFELSKDCEEDEINTDITFERNVYKVVNDICDEDSPLHKNYVASAECYKTLTDEGQQCEETAELIYRHYREFLEIEHPEKLEDYDESRRQQECMLGTYVSACVSEQIQKSCGDVANSVFLEIASRTMYLGTVCSGTFIDELKTTVERMGLEDGDKDKYMSVFDFVRK